MEKLSADQRKVLVCSLNTTKIYRTLSSHELLPYGTFLLERAFQMELSGGVTQYLVVVSPQDNAHEKLIFLLPIEYSLALQLKPLELLIGENVYISRNEDDGTFLFD